MNLDYTGKFKEYLENVRMLNQMARIREEMDRQAAAANDGWTYQNIKWLRLLPTTTN